MIYNPAAGRLRRRPELVERAAGWLASLGEIRPTPTAGPGDATRLAAEAASSGAPLVVVFGGDGTVNEAVNGLAGSQTTLAVLPGGTANVFCVETGLGTNPERAARRLASESETVRIALGRMVPAEGSPRHFLSMAGVGLDAIVVDQVNPAIKRRAGKGAYWLAGLAMFSKRLPQFLLRRNESESRRSFVLVSRVRNYGGDLEIARRVSLTDPCFEAVAFSGVYSIRYLPYLAAVLIGQASRVPGVEVSRATNLRCDPSEQQRVPVQLDGELSGNLPAAFEVVPDALTVRIPSAYIARARSQPWTISPIP